MDDPKEEYVEETPHELQDAADAGTPQPEPQLPIEQPDEQLLHPQAGDQP